jgi:hypothetical protein
MLETRIEIHNRAEPERKNLVSFLYPQEKSFAAGRFENGEMTLPCGARACNRIAPEG